MRVALLLTGFLRTYADNNGLLRSSIVDKYDTSIYCATWDVQETGCVVDDSVFDLYRPYLKKSIVVNSGHYKATTERFLYLDRDDDIFKTDDRARVHGKYWVDRLRDQWYVVKNGFDLIEEGIYDVVLRIRFDVQLTRFSILNIPEIVKPKSAWDFTDHMAYGNYRQMKKYCHMFDYIFDMYRTHNVDVSHAENMLKYYIEEYGEKLRSYTDPAIEYQIVK